MNAEALLASYFAKYEPAVVKLAAQFGEKYDSRPIWGYITKVGEAMKKK